MNSFSSSGFSESKISSSLLLELVLLDDRPLGSEWCLPSANNFEWLLASTTPFSTSLFYRLMRWSFCWSIRLRADNTSAFSCGDSSSSPLSFSLCSVSRKLCKSIASSLGLGALTCLLKKAGGADWRRSPLSLASCEELLYSFSSSSLKILPPELLSL